MSENEIGAYYACPNCGEQILIGTNQCWACFENNSVEQKPLQGSVKDHRTGLAKKEYGKFSRGNNINKNNKDFRV